MIYAIINIATTAIIGSVVSDLFYYELIRSFRSYSFGMRKFTIFYLNRMIKIGGTKSNIYT